MRVITVRVSEETHTAVVMLSRASSYSINSICQIGIKNEIRDAAAVWGGKSLLDAVAAMDGKLEASPPAP